MQHLQVLEDAGLVVGRKEGRTRLNFSNPIPIKEVLGRWLTSHSSAAAETALHLRRYAESEQEKSEKIMNENTASVEFRKVRLEMEMVVKAPPNKVYDALTKDMDAWWPHRFKPDSTIKVDCRPGGMIEECYVNGGGAVFGYFMQLEPGRKIASSAPSAMNSTFFSFNTETMEDHPDGTLYKKTLVFFGDVPEAVETMFKEGMKSLTESALKGFLEQGQGYTKPGEGK